MHSKYCETIETLRMWAQREKTIHGVLLLGSQVRTAFAGDEWSDLDVLLLVEHPHIFLQNSTWLTEFGDIVCMSTEETPLDWIQLTWSVTRVLFADNRAIDFSILPSDRLDDVLSMNAGIHAQGYQVLYDVDSNVILPKVESTVSGVNEAPPAIPTEDEIRQAINDVLFDLIWACKKIKRNELWVAVRCINHEISNTLLQCIEWYTISSTNTVQPITYDGRFLEHRTEAAILQKLPQCFAKYDVDDAIQTVSHLLDLLSWLSKAISEKNGYAFDASQFEQIRTLYHEMFGNHVVQSGRKTSYG